MYAYDLYSMVISDVVSSSNLFTVFKVLIFVNVFHLTNFGLGLSPISDFSNPEAKAPISAECSPFLLA